MSSPDWLTELLAEHDWHGAQPLHMDGIIFAHRCLCGFMWEGVSELRAHVADVIWSEIERRLNQSSDISALFVLNDYRALGASDG